MIKFVSMNDKTMSRGMRDMSKTPLTEEEIEFVKSEIKRIGADESVFVFNHEAYIPKSTCYNYADDIVYVTRNVFPDTRYGSTHPRDLMSVAAVLAHEYYGHRPYRQEYIDDDKISDQLGSEYHTVTLWQDECRASITAAKLAPNLTDQEKSHLVMDAIYRAQEEGQWIETDDFMKGVLYGYSGEDKNITPVITPIKYVSEASAKRAEYDRGDKNGMPKVPRKTRNLNDYER